MNLDIGLAIGIIVFIGSLMITALFYFILMHVFTFTVKEDDEYIETNDN
jgi:hypothetical protein